MDIIRRIVSHMDFLNSINIKNFYFAPIAINVNETIRWIWKKLYGLELSFILNRIDHIRYGNTNSSYVFPINIYLLNHHKVIVPDSCDTTLQQISCRDIFGIP